MNDGQTHLSTVGSNCKCIKEQWIKVPKSYTISDLQTDAREVATIEKVRKWKYLNSIYGHVHKYSTHFWGSVPTEPWLSF